MDTHTASRQVLRGSAAHRSRAETALDTHTAWEALLPQCTAHLFKGVRSMLGATPGMPVSALPGRAAAARGRQRPARRGQALRRSTEGAPRQRHWTRCCPSLAGHCPVMGRQRAARNGQALHRSTEGQRS